MTTINIISISLSLYYTTAAATALIDQPNFTAEQIVQKAMKIAGDICVYTNHNLVVEKIEVPAATTATGAVSEATTTPTAPSSSS